MERLKIILLLVMCFTYASYGFLLDLLPTKLRQQKRPPQPSQPKQPRNEVIYGKPKSTPDQPNDRTFYVDDHEEVYYEVPVTYQERLPNELDATVDVTYPTLPHTLPDHYDLTPREYLHKLNSNSHHSAGFTPSPALPSYDSGNFKREIGEAQSRAITVQNLTPTSSVPISRVPSSQGQQQHKHSNSGSPSIAQKATFLEEENKKLENIVIQQQFIMQQQQNELRLLKDQERQLQLVQEEEKKLAKRQILDTKYSMDMCHEKYAQLIGDIFTGHELVPEVLDSPPENLLELTFRTVRTFPGMRVTADVTRYNPFMHWPTEDGALYTVVMSNLDINSRRNRTLSEFWHWFVANIPGTDIDDGEVIFELLHPLVLPDGHGDHRFAYFVFKQPGRLDYSSEGGPTDNCSPDMSYGRGPFRSTRNFMKDYALKLVASTFLIVDHNRASDEIACEWQKCLNGRVVLEDLNCQDVKRNVRRKKPTLTPRFYTNFNPKINHRGTPKERNFWFLS